MAISAGSGERAGGEDFSGIDDARGARSLLFNFGGGPAALAGVSEGVIECDDGDHSSPEMTVAARACSRFQQSSAGEAMVAVKSLDRMTARSGMGPW